MGATAVRPSLRLCVVRPACDRWTADGAAREAPQSGTGTAARLTPGPACHGDLPARVTAGEADSAGTQRDSVRRQTRPCDSELCAPSEVYVGRQRALGVSVTGAHS